MTTTALPYRGVLTDLLVEYLSEHDLLDARDVLVGDGKEPDAAGWTGKEPGQGTYTASVLVSTQPARLAQTDLSRHRSWYCSYGLETVGGTRTQADNAADVVRDAARQFAASLGGSVELGPERWKVADSYFDSLAGVEPISRLGATIWRANDTLTLRLERERT